MTLLYSTLATLAYHDIFDYPLTLSEVRHLLVGKKATQAPVGQELARLVKAKKIGAKDGYFYLKGRAKTVNLRKQRSRWSKAKLKRASFFAQILKVIPTIKLVAISGALAMKNCHKDDDIDLVLITSAGSLWTTRFFANILLLPFKRDPRGQKIANRACLNVFIDESALKIRPPNLYLAHEICQMKPLWDRDGTYSRFIQANSWVKKYLPNWQPNRVTSAKLQVPSYKSNQFITYHLALITERTLRSFQLAYMKSKITTEKIGKHQLFFHPQDTEKWVMGKYQIRLKRLSGN